MGGEEGFPARSCPTALHLIEGWGLGRCMVLPGSVWRGGAPVPGVHVRVHGRGPP